MILLLRGLWSMGNAGRGIAWFLGVGTIGLALGLAALAWSPLGWAALGALGLAVAGGVGFIAQGPETKT